MPSTSDTVLYVRLPNWIGDVCMSLPSVEALLASGRPLVVCARPWAKTLLAAYPLHGFIPMHTQWWRNRHTIRQSLRQAPQRPLGLLLPDSLSSALAFRLAGIASAGYRDEGRSVLLRWPVEKPARLPHTVVSWYELTRTALAAWRLPVPCAQPPSVLELRLHAQHRHHAQAIASTQALCPHRFILIAPTATGLHRGQIKVWPLFDALTRKLQALGHTVVMCPPPAEVQAARANAPTALCLPPLDLGAFAALASMAALVICNDSGVSHLAAAVQARQFTLMGVTDATRTGPWSPQAVCLGKEGCWPSLEEVYTCVQAQLEKCA